jgi:hypothetical protein
LRLDLPLVSLAEGTSVASIAGRLAAAVSTAPAEGELIALFARHEGVEASPFPAGAGRAGSAMLDTKPVAAE